MKVHSAPSPRYTASTGCQWWLTLRVMVMSHSRCIENLGSRAPLLPNGTLVVRRSIQIMVDLTRCLIRDDNDPSVPFNSIALLSPLTITVFTSHLSRAPWSNLQLQPAWSQEHLNKMELRCRQAFNKMLRNLILLCITC